MKDLPFFLTVEEVLAFHADQIREFGGSKGLRDEGALESAVAQAQVTFDGEYRHEGVFRDGIGVRVPHRREPAIS